MADSNALHTDDCPAVVASIRLGVCFGDIPGKQFLNVEYPFDGTPEGFDRAFELCRVAYHEAARERVRPCGFEGPWVEATSVEVASESPVGL